MRVTWLGHSTLLVESGGARILTDPVLRDRLGPLVRIAASVDVQALGRLDGVLLSHLHADHADPRSLRAVAAGVPVLAPRGAARWVKQAGIEDVTELGAGDEGMLAGLPVRATPATHEGRRWPFGPSADSIGYLVGAARTAYFAGDTDLFPEMAELRGAVSLALLPVWGWGRSLGPGHLDPRRAAEAAAIIAPVIAVPIHWGTFAPVWPARRAVDPAWPAREFAARTARVAPQVDVRVLAPGETIEL